MTHLIKISDEVQRRIKNHVDHLINRYLRNLPVMIDFTLNQVVESYLGLVRGRYRERSPLKILIESKAHEIGSQLLNKIDFTIPDEAKERLIAEAYSAYQTHLQTVLDELAYKEAREKARSLLAQVCEVKIDEVQPITIEYPSEAQLHDPDYGETALEKAFLEHKLRCQK